MLQRLPYIASDFHRSKTCSKTHIEPLSPYTLHCPEAASGSRIGARIVQSVAAAGVLTLWGSFSLLSGLFQGGLAVRAEGFSGSVIAPPLRHTQIATTLSKTDIAQQIKNLSVLIQGQAGSGSGVIVQHQGQTYTVITAAHVVTNSIPYTVTLADEHTYRASSVKRLSGVDLAIVTFTSDRPYPVAVLGSSQGIGEASPIYVAGFPAGTAAITRSVYTFTEGTLTARSSKPFSDGYAMVYTNNTLPGMSGGGVFNQFGQLVGIHGRGDVDNKLETSQTNPNIVVKTGFNLGIPIETLAARGAEVGLKLSILPASNPVLASPGDDLIVSATSKAQQGDYNGAIADMSRAIEQSPKTANLYFARANYAISMGRGEDALKDLDRVIQLNPQSESAYWIRGNYRFSLNDKAGAISDLSEVIRINPKHLQAYEKRAFFYSTQPNPVQAIADYTAILKLDPQNQNAYEMRAMWWSGQGDNKSAFADYSQLIQLNPKNVGAYLQRGKIRQVLKDIEGAITDYKAALKIEPQNKMVYDALAYLEKEKDPIAFNNQQIKNNPKDIEALEKRARNAFASENYAQAIADYSSILMVDPKNKSILSDRANVYIRATQFDKSIRDYTTLIQLNPQSPEYYGDRAEVYEKIGETEKEIADYQTAARLYRAQKDERNAKSSEESIERLKILTKQVADLTEGINKDPQNPWRYWDRALVNSTFKNAKGDFEKAKELFRRQGNTEKVQQCETFIQSIECELKAASCKK
jgi:tetratricopeptide (TPR) repeat protein/S1-C subfamily serine protease